MTQEKLEALSLGVQEFLLSHNGLGVRRGELLTKFHISPNTLDSILAHLGSEVRAYTGERLSTYYAIGSVPNGIPSRVARPFKPMKVFEPDELKRAREGRPEGFGYKSIC
jgi:hypothetical protein